MCPKGQYKYEARQVFKSLNFNEYVLLINGIVSNIS